MKKKYKNFFLIALSPVFFSLANAHDAPERYQCGDPTELINYNILDLADRIEDVTLKFEKCIKEVASREKRAIEVHSINLENSVDEWNNYARLYNGIKKPLWQREAGELIPETDINGDYNKKGEE